MKKIVIILIVLFNIQNSFAQNLNAADPDELYAEKDLSENSTYKVKPLAYPYVSEKDILWSKTVWEKIDLKQKVNIHLYYPTDTNEIASNRRSLFDVIMNGIRTGKIKKVYSDSYFRTQLSNDEVLEITSTRDTLDAYKDMVNNGEVADTNLIKKLNVKAGMITSYNIKGIWYFDKRLGEMRYRLLAIAPVSKPLVKDENNPNVETVWFWVWYPSAREALSEYTAFNHLNPTKSISYDHVMNTRMFSSVIYKEENRYEDREINKYIPNNALFQLQEAERIKEEIRNFELEMWNY